MHRRPIQSVAGALRDVIERAGGVSASQGRILFGASSSSRANKVQWIAAEAGVVFTQVTTPTAELKQNEDYLQLNPKGTVPTWVECSLPVPFVLNESNSIVAHIAEEGGLSPRDGRARALAWQWQEYGETSLQPAGSPVWWGYKYGSGVIELWGLNPGQAAYSATHTFVLLHAGAVPSRARQRAGAAGRGQAGGGRAASGQCVGGCGHAPRRRPAIHARR